jgi:hypothetical protein
VNQGCGGAPAICCGCGCGRACVHGCGCDCGSAAGCPACALDHPGPPHAVAAGGRWGVCGRCLGLVPCPCPGCPHAPRHLLAAARIGCCRQQPHWAAAFGLLRCGCPAGSGACRARCLALDRPRPLGGLPAGGASPRAHGHELCKSKQGSQPSRGIKQQLQVKVGDAWPRLGHHCCAAAHTASTAACKLACWQPSHTLHNAMGVAHH